MRHRTALLSGLIVLGLSIDALCAVKVIAVKSSAWPMYDLAMKGFRDCLKSPGVSLTEIVLPDDPVQLEALAVNIRNQAPNVVLAFGSSAARFARDKVGAPTVFCMMIDPLASDFTSSGVALDLRPALQVEYIQKNFPQLKRIGVIYNPGRNREVVAELKDMRKRGAADLVLVEATAIDQMNAAVAGLVGKADCLLMLSDPTIYSPDIAPQLIMDTLQRNIPIISASPAYIKAGALAGVYADSENNGCLAGHIAGRILAGERPGDIALQWPTKTRSAVNLVVAERLKIKVGEAAIKAAEQVIK